MEKIYNETALPEVAAWLWSYIRKHRVIALHGDMGAGKTTLVHALCEYLGVKDTVSSPTFSIINEYVFDDNGKSGSIYHIDLYRLKDEEEAIRAGVEDCMYSDAYCWVEWPERATGLFPEDTLHVFISLMENGERKISFDC